MNLSRLNDSLQARVTTQDAEIARLRSLNDRIGTIGAGSMSAGNGGSPISPSYPQSHTSVKPNPHANFGGALGNPATIAIGPSPGVESPGGMEYVNPGTPLAPPPLASPGTPVVPSHNQSGPGGKEGLKPKTEDLDVQVHVHGHAHGHGLAYPGLGVGVGPGVGNPSPGNAIARTGSAGAGGNAGGGGGGNRGGSVDAREGRMTRRSAAAAAAAIAAAASEDGDAEG